MLTVFCRVNSRGSISLVLFLFLQLVPNKVTAQQTDICFPPAAFGGLVAGIILGSVILTAAIVFIVIHFCCSLTPLSKLKPKKFQIEGAFSLQRGVFPVSTDQSTSARTSARNSIIRQVVIPKLWGLPNALRTLVAHTECDPKFVNELTVENAEDLGFSLSVNKEFIFIKEVDPMLQLSHLRIMESGEHILGMTIGFHRVPLEAVLSLLSIASPYHPTLYIRKDVRFNLSDLEGHLIVPNFYSPRDTFFNNGSNSGSSLSQSDSNPFPDILSAAGLIRDIEDSSDLSSHVGRFNLTLPLSEKQAKSLTRSIVAGSPDDACKMDEEVFHRGLKTDTGRLSELRYTVHDKLRKNPLFGIDNGDVDRSETPDESISSSRPTLTRSSSSDNSSEFCPHRFRTVVQSEEGKGDSIEGSLITPSDYTSDIDVMAAARTQTYDNKGELIGSGKLRSDMLDNESSVQEIDLSNRNVISGYFVRVKQS